MDFLTDLDEIISDKIGDINNKTGFNIQITDSEIPKRLQKLFNLKFKMISQKVRNVHYSSELRSKTLTEPYVSVLKEIEEKFKNGDDLNPYLSRHAFDPEFQDGLLNDWGIHHLHLNNRKDNEIDYLYSTSGCLLFVAVGETDVYFLETRPHNESYRSSPEYPLWVRNEFLKIIKNNWNNLLKSSELDGFKPAEPMNRDDQIVFRDNNVYTLAQIDDKVYLPFGGGITTSGVGGRQVEARTGLLTDLSRDQRYIENKTDEIKE